MKFKLPITIAAILAFGGGMASYILAGNRGHAASLEEHDHGAETEAPKGPHGGHLLAEAGFGLELAVVAEDGKTGFRAWFTQDGRAVAPAAVKLAVELRRPDGTVEHHAFAPEAEFARSADEVAEPHSFTVTVVAEQGGRTHRWTYDSPELQARLTPEAAQRAGVVVATAGPAEVRETLSVYGRVMLNGNRVARAVPRFGGIVREARKSFGDPVQAGETVAVVEANQSLATLEVKAPIAGVIVDRDVNSGETVGDGVALYTIADLSDVWVDLNVPKRDQARVRVGQTAVIHADDGGPDATGVISWISPVSSPEAQTLIARIVLPNPERRWRPGLYVKAEITLRDGTVAVAVAESAIQTLDPFTVVFSQHGDVYQARPLALGRRGGGLVEVLGGLRAGERYVIENSFLLKAELGKAGAEHVD
ncbi:MAG: efflux RND transporter periplasmic adaptor subunit [Verrucomicrobia bacterium]|nr:efflux RND transporter periplasmic adaptor subunit [Verrucomicrobiota bacterium]